MGRVRRSRLASFAVAVALVVPGFLVLTATPARAATFPSSAGLTLNDPNSQNTGQNNATATPYPSTIAVSGLSGTISKVTATLSNVTYSHSQDIDALLVGPGGQTLILVANLGPNSGAGAAASSSTLTLDDAGVLPASGMITPWGSSSTFKPVNYGGFNEVWIAPAPAGPYGDPGTAGTGATLGSVFNGTNPNGTWSLYVITTAGGDGTGSVGGWSLDITSAALAATTTTLSSDTNPSFTTAPGNAVTLTATVHKAGDSSAVNEGTATFKDGGSTIAACAAQSVAAGTATCPTSFGTEGGHVITVQFNATANFAQSSASLTQQVDDHTTVTGNSYCNTGSVALNNPPNTVADATPYPSHVFVSGLATSLSHLTVTLSNTTYSHSQDIDALLVGPGGQTLILVANLGPNSGTGAAAGGSTLTLDDAGVLPASGQSTPWGSSSTFKPVNYGGFNQVWGPPAPYAPYGDPGTTGTGATLGSVYNGTNPNGTWSLYLITTAGGDGTGAVAGGWCAGVTAANLPGTTTALGSDNNPSFTTGPGNAVTLTATVHKASDNSAVNEGTVTFKDGGTTITGCAAQAVSAGTATCPTSFGTEGSHVITAQFNATANFGQSSASFSQQVDDHTTVTGNSYCNPGSVALNNPPTTVADAAPYPSHVFVSGRSGGLLHLSVTLNNTTYSHSQDIDALLVGPGGQTLILVSNLGPNSGAGAAASGSTLTLDDAGVLPASGQSTPWGSSSTFKPVNYGGLNQVWGPPAPAGSHGGPGTAGTGATLGSVFNGTSPNGTWSLYLITTAAGDGTGAVAGGWCLGVTTPSPPVLTKAFGATSIPLNGSTSATFSISNPNASASLSGVGFTDTLPSGLVVATSPGLTGSCGGGTITATAGSGSLSLSGATLTGGASCTFSVNVTGISAGTKVNTTSTVSSAEGGSGPAATATLVVVAPPVISKTFGASSVPVNGTTSLTFSITNPAVNPGSENGVGFTDTLPAGLVVATSPGLTGSCGGGTITAIAGSGSVSLSGATLGVAASCTFSVNVTATTSGADVNSVTVSSTNGGTGNTATASLNVAAPPSISAAFGAPSIPFGATTSLGFTLSNPNSATGLTGVGFTDTLPAGLVVSTPNGLTGSCGGGTITATAGSGGVSLSGATLGAAASCTFSVNVTATGVGGHVNSVTATSVEGGTGNTASASLTVVVAPTGTTITASPTTAAPGAPITFTATVAPAQTNASGVNPSGTVTFFLDGQAVAVATVTLNGGQATYTTSTLSPGAHSMTASYSGDADFAGSSSPAPASVVVNFAPSLATSASAPSGAGLTDTATLSGGSTTPPPSGTITFSLFGPDNVHCSGTPALTSSKAVSGAGTYTSDPFLVVTPGAYRWVASYSGDAHNTPAGPGACGDPGETVSVNIAVFPALANGAYGGYVTAATIQNAGAAPAQVSISYVDQTGAAVGTGDTNAALPANAGWTVRQDNGHSFPAGGAGSAIVYSNQPIASFVNEFAPGNMGDATSYTGITLPSGVGSTLYAPTIVNNAYGHSTTGIGLLNLSSGPVDVTISYRDGTGATITTQTLTGLGAHAYQGLYSGDVALGLPDHFAGTATITSSTGAPLAAIVNETGAGGQFSSYDTVPAGSTLLNAPVALNNAFGGYFTGMGIQNTAATAGSVSVTYDGQPATVHTFPIAANGYLGIYQGSPTDGSPPGSHTAVIQGTVPLAAVVNEVAPVVRAWAQQSTSYNTFPGGSGVLHLPLVENGGSDPWNTGEGIMNTGAAATTVTVTYHDAATGAAIGTPQTSTLAPLAFLALYQPDATSGLPAGSRATAVVTTASGGQVAVITNESGATMFMSYNGQ